MIDYKEFFKSIGMFFLLIIIILIGGGILVVLIPQFISI